MQKLLDELRLRRDETNFPFKNAQQIEPPTQPSDTLAIRTRSLLEIGIYLSHGVDVPEAHKEAGIARRDTGEEPNLSDLFSVRVSASKPKEPGIAVKYRNHWFYIPDSDHDSKRTFGFVQAIFLSQLVEDTSQGAPVLTLPLN